VSPDARVAFAALALIVVPRIVSSQPCIPIVGHDRDAAMARAIAADGARIGLSPVDSLSGVPIGPVVRTDSAGAVVVVVATFRATVAGFAYAGLATADSLCAVQPRATPRGFRADVGAMDEWNDALLRVAPTLLVTGEGEARGLARAAIAYATGCVWDTVWTSADAVAEGWSVTGALSHAGWRHRFRVNMSRSGRLMDLFLQYPPDPPTGTP
jgi:hypothetical protein